MSEDEATRMGMNEDEQDDVEGHRKHVTANEEPEDEAMRGVRKEGDDEVEAHKFTKGHPKRI